MKNKTLKNALNYISKLFSTALLVLLIIVGVFLVYYLISAKMVSNNPKYEPKINLYTIVSGSMEPNIKVYDVIVDYKINSPEDLKIGDVITFRSTSTISKDLIVTHRIVDIKEVNGKVEYVTKGDYNSSADSDTAKFDHIIGKVVLKFPQLGRLQFFLASKFGWFIVVLLPAMCVIIYDILKLIKLLSLKKSGDNIKPTNAVEESKTTVDNKETHMSDYQTSSEEHFQKEEENLKIEDEIIIAPDNHYEEKNVEDEHKTPKSDNIDINKDDVTNNKVEQDDKINQNNQSNNNNNNGKHKKKKKHKNKDFNNDKIINDTLESIKKSDYVNRLNNLKDFENRK